MPDHKGKNYKWYVLFVVVLVNLGTGLALISMPPLFSEIARDLSLSLVQLGALWGFASLPGLFFAIPSGLFGDRFGVRSAVSLGLFSAGVALILRGLSTNLFMIASFMFLYGALNQFANPNLPKTIRIWFEPKQLGLTMGITGAATGAGTALAMMFTGTVFSQALGGWRHVMFAYGGVVLLLGVVWLLTIKERPSPETLVPGDVSPGKMRVPFKQAFSRVIHIKTVWLIGIATLCMAGANMSLMGYMPIFLEKAGMTRAVAATTTSLWLWGWLFGSIVGPILSDKIGLRRIVYVLFGLVLAATIFVLPYLHGSLLSLLSFGSGFFAAGAFQLHYVVTTEMKSIGPVYAGTAIGLASTISALGSFLFPIIGGRLAQINPVAPFPFWAAMPIIAAACFFFIEETGWRNKSSRT